VSTAHTLKNVVLARAVSHPVEGFTLSGSSRSFAALQLHSEFEDMLSAASPHVFPAELSRLSWAVFMCFTSKFSLDFRSLFDARYKPVLSAPSRSSGPGFNEVSFLQVPSPQMFLDSSAKHKVPSRLFPFGFSFGSSYASKVPVSHRQAFLDLQKDFQLVEKALLLGLVAHKDQLRASKDPYFTHPLHVAFLIAHLGLDAVSVAAGLTHDVVEDTSVSLKKLNTFLSPSVGVLVDGVTKLDRVSASSVFTSSKLEQNSEQKTSAVKAATLRKLMVSTAKDVRVLLIKLADRLHNVRTLSALKPDKAHRIAQESLEVFAPLAQRLGAQEFKHEIQDRCFKILFPDKAAAFEKMISARVPLRSETLSSAASLLAKNLVSKNVAAEVTARPKNLYSIYEKMKSTGRSFDEIFDLIGLRIVVSSVEECYTALGVTHALFSPLHGRFADYIATPKVNFYQSLHTTVVASDGSALEVQIRTKQMHDRAEAGVAAHWRYKQSRELAKTSSLDSLTLPSLDVLRNITDPDEFLETVKLDLYQEEVLVLSPEGELFSLPSGATPIDFAYRVHSQLGDRTVGARVNGNYVSLDYRLVSGDQVEILTANPGSSTPDPSWLRFVATPKARHHIRRALRSGLPESESAALLSRIQDELEREGLMFASQELLNRLKVAAWQFEFEKLSDLQDAIDAKLIALGDVLDLVRGSLGQINPEQDASGRVLVEGIGEMVAVVASCCSPSFGESIVGYSSKGKGVVVHGSSCSKVALDPSNSTRLIVQVSWSKPPSFSLTSSLHVAALDRQGLLAELGSAVTTSQGYILFSQSRSTSDVAADFFFQVQLSSSTHLNLLKEQLLSVPGVYKVSEIQNIPLPEFILDSSSDSSSHATSQTEVIS